MSISHEIKESFWRGSALTRLIYVNLIVFLAVKILYVLLFLFNRHTEGYALIMEFLSVPASFSKLLIKPWTILSYMFLHFSFLHILFNLLWLYWFGQVFLQYFTPKQMVSVYIIGGVCGAAVYIVAYNIFPVFIPVVNQSQAMGASAAVMAIAMATAFYVPNYIFHLMFIGQVKIKYIALFFIFTDIIMIADSNAGGHLAHLGGAFFGYLFAMSFRNGFDVTKSFNRVMDNLVTIFKRPARMKVTYNQYDDMEWNRQKAEEQKEIDRILDKISQSGYEKLTKKEKDFLFSKRGR